MLDAFLYPLCSKYAGIIVAGKHLADSKLILAMLCKFSQMGGHLDIQFGKLGNSECTLID